MLSTIDLVELEVLRITSAPPAAARLFPSRTISSAPRSRIILSLSGECEIAIVSKPAAFAYCTARCPSPPIPSTATRSAGLGSAQRSPLHTVYPAQKIGAACSYERLSGRSAVPSSHASMYSAWLPWVLTRLPRACVQHNGRPRWHHWQRPHDA